MRDFSALHQTAWQRLLLSLLAYFVVAKLGLSLSLPAGFVSLFWPAAGMALVLVWFWQAPAVLGVMLGSLCSNLTADEHGDQLLALPLSYGSVPLLTAIATGAGVQAWVSVQLLARKRQQLVDGHLRGMALARLMLLIGPVACLINATIAGLAFGWLTLPFNGSDMVFWVAWWLGDSLGVLMLAPALILVLLHPQPVSYSASSLRNPWLLLGLVALPAWLLAGYANIEQVNRERQQFDTVAEQLRSNVQAGLDGTAQKLRALQAFYMASNAVTRSEFNTFGNALLERTPLLLGLAWAPRVNHADRPEIEAQLTAQLDRNISIGELSAQGLGKARYRPEYWPLFQIVPQEREAILGFDLASEPFRQKALMQARSSGKMTASTRLLAVGAASGKLPAVFLYLPTGRPVNGMVVAALKIEVLLAGSSMAQQLLGSHRSLSLNDEQGNALAWLSPPDVLGGNIASAFSRKLPLHMGNHQWQLSVNTARADVPYLKAPLWWLGQLLPQLLCMALGLLMVLDAGREKTLLQLERQHDGLIERQQPELPRAATPIKRFDFFIEKGWQERGFVPRFEPVVELATGQVRGVEALLRWPGAPAGLITPDIIEWAERKNLIAELDEQILAGALHALARWPISRGQTFTLAVNVSANEMLDPHWASRILKALDVAGVAGKRLCLEITEGVLLRPDAQVLAQLTRLRAAGVKVALDDFGTGYSSIGYLRQLPVDRIKLDRMFIAGLASDLKAREIVASVVKLAMSLNVEVVAEGVEDAITAEVLQQLGCPLAQGWLFSKAVNANTVAKWVGGAVALYPDHAMADVDFELGGELTEG